MYVSMKATDPVTSVEARVEQDGNMRLFLYSQGGLTVLEETELGLLLTELEKRRQAGDGAVESGAAVLAKSLAIALRDRHIDADEYAAGIVWLNDHK